MACILYVEDNVALRESVAELLAAPGRELRVCASAEEALEMPAADLLITDVSLPGISGVELARQLLAEGRCRGVVLCTGHADPALADDVGAGCALLTKPFDIDQLEAAVCAQLARAAG